MPNVIVTAAAARALTQHRRERHRPGTRSPRRRWRLRLRLRWPVGRIASLVRSVETVQIHRGDPGPGGQAALELVQGQRLQWYKCLAIYTVRVGGDRVLDTARKGIPKRRSPPPRKSGKSSIATQQMLHNTQPKTTVRAMGAQRDTANAWSMSNIKQEIRVTGSRVCGSENSPLEKTR